MQSLLFSPLKIDDLQIKNRVVMPPMCMYKAKNENGQPRCFHRLHYAARALGGVGLIIVEATAVGPRGRITSRDLGLWSDEQLEAHARLVKECVKYGAVMAVQLAHAGRKSECDDLIAPSAVKFSESYKTPRQMSTEDIALVKQAFVQPAIRAERAGYAATEGEALLLGGVCDAVAYGRELLRNPNFAQAAMSELGCSELIENSYKRAFK